jgi:hypothetical protein
MSKNSCFISQMEGFLFILKRTRRHPEQKKGQVEHRTATTAYPCYLPVLGGSAGAGRADSPGGKSNKNDEQLGVVENKP